MFENGRALFRTFLAEGSVRRARPAPRRLRSRPAAASPYPFFSSVLDRGVCVARS